MYCVKCGVELSDKEHKCPLCNTAVYDPESHTIKKPQQNGNVYKERATVRYIRNKYCNITGFCLFTLMFILAIINLSVNGKFSWSVIPLVSIAFLWFCMVFPVKYAKKLNPVIIVTACIGAANAFMLAIDALTVFKGWSLYVLFSSAFACFSVLIAFLSKLKLKHIISFITAAAALLVVSIDFKAGFSGWSIYTGGGLALAWSFTLLPFYINRKYNVIGAIVFNSILILAYLFFVLVANGYADRFLSLAVPLVVTIALPVIIIRLVYINSKCSAFGVLSLCFFFVALISLSVDKILNLNIYKDDILFHEWSIITASCCFAVAVLLFIVERNYKLREFLEKKLNV